MKEPSKEAWGLDRQRVLLKEKRDRQSLIKREAQAL